MAIYHATTTPISRGAGHSATAKSAYIACEKITNEITGEIHNYVNKQGLEHSEIILPDGIDEKITAQQLWNKAEQAEKRKDARVGREWVIALPHELDKMQRKELADELSKNLANHYQVATQYAIHMPSKQGDERNYHVHILCTTRQIDKNLNLGEKAHIERENKSCALMKIPKTQEQIVQCREQIANTINLHLEKQQIKNQVTHLSYKDQGIDKAPTVHMGKHAIALERKGIMTFRGEYNRNVALKNQLAQEIHKVYEQSYNFQRSRELSIVEQTKLYLQQQTKVYNKLEPAPENNQQQKTELLTSILAKKSMDEIIKQRKDEMEKQKEQQRQEQQEYQKKLSYDKGLCM